MAAGRSAESESHRLHKQKKVAGALREIEGTPEGRYLLSVSLPTTAKLTDKQLRLNTSTKKSCVSAHCSV